MTEPQLSRLLQESADRHDPGPPPFADIAARSATGRQRHRRRTTLVVCLAAAAMVVTTGVTAVVRDRGADPSPAAGGERLDLPTQPVPSIVMQALLSGRLTLDERDCVALTSGRSSFVPVWPDGYTAELDAGKVVVIGPGGKMVAHDGDLISASGGFTAPDAPHRCIDGPDAGILQDAIEVLPSTPLDLPTSDWRPGEGGDGALASGTIALKDGCLVLAPEEKGPATSIVWPAGWSATREGEHGVTLRDPAGRVVAHEGDTVTTGGGAGPRSSVPRPGCLPPRGADPFLVQSEVEVAE